MNISTVYIEITNKCNLNCRDCYNSSGLNKKLIEICPESFKDIVSKFISFGVKEINISGGEPTLHSRWTEMLEVMREFDFPFFIVSNGTTKSDEFIKLLENDKNFSVQFSLDGADEETNAKTRGKGNFEKTIKKIEELKPVNQVYMKMVVSRYNFHQIEDYILLAKKDGCKAAFSFVNKLGNANIDFDEINLTDEEKINVIKTIEIMKDRHGVDCSIPYATFKCPLLDSESEMNIAVKPTGEIMPCQIFYDSYYSIGSVYDLEFDKIEQKLAELRDLLSAWVNNRDKCGKCMNRCSCEKGCPAFAFDSSGQASETDGWCNFRKLHTVKISLADYLKKQKAQ